MLVLSRKLNQEIVIGENVTIRVLKIKGNTIRLGIDAPRDVKIVRGELPMELVVDLPRQSDEDQHENMAEVTVVFSSDVNQESETLDVIPFRRDDLTTQSNEGTRPHHSPQSGANFSPKHNEADPTVRFRSRLPESFQHNRLKDLVKELTEKGCRATKS